MEHYTDGRYWNEESQAWEFDKSSEINNFLAKNGWGLRRHVSGEIIVTHKDGSGAVIREGTKENNVQVIESMFYRMMNDFITAK